MGYRTIAAAALLLALGATAAIGQSQDPPPARTPPSPPPPESGPESGPEREAGPESDRAEAAPPTIRFNFKGASFDQVIDYFARVTGLPVVRETDVPQGTLDYLAPEQYTLEEALDVLNIILHARGVALRVSDDMLYLQKLEEMQRENIPTFVGRLPGDVGDEDVVTVVRPLEIALAAPLAEKLAAMVAAYGSVTAMEQQNSLVITETAGQVRRLLMIVDELDRQDPEGVVEIFPLRHARAADLMTPLKALLAQKVEKYVIDQQGKQVKIEEESLPGLAISADDRTNAIIAKGVQSRIDRLREAIELLDVPATGTDRAVRSFTLARMSPDDAAARLNEMFARLPEADRPTVLALRDLGKVTLIGPAEAIDEATALLHEIDGGIEPQWSEPETSIAVIALNHAAPKAVADALRGLLSRRELLATKMIAGPDGRSLIVSGLSADVEAIELLAPTLDRPAAEDRTARLFRLTADDPRETYQRSRALYADQVEPDDPRWALDYDFSASKRLLTVVGPARAVARFGEALRAVEQTDVIELETRQIELAGAVPGEVAESLRALARPLLEPRDGREYVAPQITAVDALGLLIVTARPEQFAAIETLAATLDRPGPGTPPLRILQLQAADAAGLARVLADRYGRRPRDERIDKPVDIAADRATNSLIVAAHPDLLPEIRAVVEELNGAPIADELQVRTVFLEHARAERVAPVVAELLSPRELVDVNRLPAWVRGQLMMTRMREGPAPAVRVAADSRLNAVVISGPLPLLDAAEQVVTQLDVDPAAAPSTRRVRVLVVANADARELADNLTAIFDQQEQVEPPPTIRVDRSSNSLLVLATDAQFETIEAVALELDDATIAASREMRMIQLDPARASASEIARTLQKMLGRSGGPGVRVITLEELLERPEAESKPPPGPTSALPVPLPAWKAIVTSAFAFFDDEQEQEPGGLTIAVDPATNSLIVVGAPRALDRVAELARELVGQLPAPPGRIHYIGLPEALDAATTARVIVQAVGQITPPGGRRGDLRRRVAVIADRAGNALVVACNDHDFEIVGDLIAALSRPATTEQMMVKVYPLRTITAERAAESVRGMLDPAAQRGRQTQRMRDLAVTLLAGDRTIEAVFDPQRVRVNTDPQNNALIVMGPPDAIGFVDQFVELLDQTPVNVQTTLKLYPLRHARAPEVQRTLRSIFQARFRSLQGRMGGGAIQPEFAADDRTNTLLVTASPEQLAEVDALLEQLDRKLGDERQPLQLIELTAAQPQQAARILEQVVIGTDQARRATTMIVPDDATGVLLVRAGEEVLAEIHEVLAEIDRPPTREYLVRTIVLERADASAVASALQRLYDDRARIASAGRGRRERSRQVSIIGDRNSNTVLVASSDEDFEEIEALIAQFDTPQASQALSFRVFLLEHAKANEIEQTVQGIINEISFAEEGPWWAWWARRPDQQGRGRRGVLAVQADARLNALIVTGEGDKFEVIEQLIDVLDSPEPAGERRVVKLYPLRHADVEVVAEVLLESFAHRTRYRRWWEEPDRTEVRIRSDARNKIIFVYGTAKQQEEIAAFIAGIDEQAASPDQEFAVLPVEFAQARDVAATLNQFLRDRARATGAPPPTATVVGSRTANTLLVSAEPDDLATLRDLLTRLDQPDVSGDRTIEILALADGDADEIARIVRQQFSRGGGQQGGAGVVVTPDARTNSLIVNAPRLQFAQVRALVERLDAPSAADETIIRTYALEGARAQDAVRILGEALQLDERGETDGITIRLEEMDGPPVEVKARIVADRRSNSLIVTATEESFPVIEALVARLDEVPAVSPVEYRIIPLEHALAIDVSWTLRQFMRSRRGGDEEPEPRIDYNRLENQLIVAATADQFEQIDKIIRELDQPATSERVTDFVPLRFAQAEQVQEALSVFYGPLAYEADTPGKLNARIVADPATNSLVITADESEWADIRALLAKLDSEEYDVSLQLRVIPLTYADARSVARAINEAFSTDVSRSERRSAVPPPPAPGDGQRRDERVAPSVLVEAEEWVRAAAEPQTNSVIVSASRQNIAKIERIVAELDVADYAKLPPPRIIPVRAGSPGPLAESLRRLYEQDDEDRGRKALRIVGDQASNSIIVRAEEEDFLQIRTLAEALMSEASQQGLSVHVLRLRAAPVQRVAEAVREAYAAAARQADVPLAVQADVAGNTLVVACTAAMFAQIRETVDQLDALSPAAGQGIFIIELEHVSPEAASNVVETIGLDRPPPDDSTSRLVTEPIRVVPLSGRNAVIVVANPVDRDTIVGLFKAIDSEPKLAEAHLRVIRLHNAEAEALAGILQAILTPAEQQAETPLARAVQEQVRRLSVRHAGAGDLRLDLTRPIRIIADPALNALVISSTPENVAALAEVVAIFDQVPVTDAVTVQLLPLNNIAAADFARIVRELFEQGKDLGGVPGADLDGVPEGRIGEALLDEVALSVDERTNTVIVAGKVNAVALVQVLHGKIDRDTAGGWLEPRIVPLRFVDAEDLAELLQAVLVEGVMDGEQAGPLQRQVGRLRMARMSNNGGRVLEADVFRPMTRLVIQPAPKLNALFLVGTPMNLEVVSELVRMLDVEAAAPGSAVRIYPLEHASASRLAATIARLFEQQVQAGTLRPDDRVIIEPDERTNALVVTTSRTSFDVVEGLIEMLDATVAPELGTIRRIVLANASAARVASLAQQLMDARVERLRRSEPETAELARATIVADARTNSLVVAAGRETFEIVERLVADLDTTSLTGEALIRVVPVTRGNVQRIADTINAVMDRRYADLPDDVRQSQRPLVMTDPGSNSLLVAAGPDDAAAIAALVEKLDAAPSNPAIRLAVIPIDTANADQLAPRVESVMRQRQQSLGTAGLPSDRVAIEPDTASNSLIVAASEENIQVIRDLVSALTQTGWDSEGGTDIEVLQLVSSEADEMVALLDELYVAEANRRRGTDTVQVAADPRLNAVLVNAPAGDLLAIRELVARLEGTRPSGIVEIKYISLTSANALETVSLIESVLAGRGIGSGRGTRQATVLRYLREYAEGRLDDRPRDRPLSEMEVSAAVRDAITLTPDLRTNTIIVSAPRDAMAVIERMIRDLDASSLGTQNVRIFKLENADAVAMAEILTDLFNLSQQGNLYVLKPRERRTEDELTIPASATEGPVAALIGAELTAVPDDRRELSLTVDSRTNSLLVSGTPVYLDLVEEVVRNLDSLEANERDVFVYPLRNAVAGEVAEVLSDFVAQEQQKLLSTLSPDQLGSAARLLEREITIVGDEKSNTVLVSASPRYMGTVKKMITELDVDPPQVLIQVLLAEITLDSGLEWGVDTRYDVGPYGEQNVFFRGASSLASAFLPTLGIPNFSVSGDDFTLLLKALEVQGRIQVLSNPSVMAANNQPARIQIGENIGRASSSSISSGGTQQVLVEFLDIGVILEVTPSINPDGFVRMTVVPEITILTNETTQVTEDLAVPILTKRSASTTVTVRDGQTIVIGGLIQDMYELRKQKVPILGDIPLLGLLFQSEFEDSAKTELLIVLTPQVITSPTNAARVDELRQREISRMSVSPKEKEGLNSSFLQPEERTWRERIKEERRQKKQAAASQHEQEADKPQPQPQQPDPEPDPEQEQNAPPAGPEPENDPEKGPADG